MYDSSDARFKMKVIRMDFASTSIARVDARLIAGLTAHFHNLRAPQGLQPQRSVETRFNHDSGGKTVITRYEMHYQIP